MREKRHRVKRQVSLCLIHWIIYKHPSEQCANRKTEITQKEAVVRVTILKDWVQGCLIDVRKVCPAVCGRMNELRDLPSAEVCKHCREVAIALLLLLLPYICTIAARTYYAQEAEIATETPGHTYWDRFPAWYILADVTPSNIP